MRPNLEGDDYKKIFASDNGALLDLRVFDTELQDWNILLEFLKSCYVCVYSEDGVAISLPRAESIWKRQKEVTVLVEILLPGFTLNCHFFDLHQIELDVLPEDVDSKDKAAVVFKLMTAIASLLGKEVFLMPEGSYLRERLHDVAVCVADPKTGLIRSRRGDIS
jgi:hypothetical protein